MKVSGPTALPCVCGWPVSVMKVGCAAVLFPSAQTEARSKVETEQRTARMAGIIAVLHGDMRAWGWEIGGQNVGWALARRHAQAAKATLRPGNAPSNNSSLC